MSITKIHIPPLQFGFASTYWATRSFSLAGLGRSFNYTPRIALPPQTFVDKGCSTVNINAGYAGGPSGHVGEYTSVNRANRSVFLGPEYIQDSMGMKHFSDFTLDDCRTAANYAWNRANGYGVITSGAQEGRFDNDYWAQLTAYSLDAYKNLSRAWGELMVANPGMMYVGCYDGIVYLDMSDTQANFRNALSSNANALAYMIAHNYGPNPYFQQGLYAYHPPLLNLYFRSSTDLNQKYAEVRLAIQLAKMALAAVGKSWPVTVFVFPGKTEFVSHVGEGYSELMKRDTPGGGTMEEYGFPGYSHAFQWDQTFTALANAEIYYGWEDTLIWGTDPSIVPPDIIRGDGIAIRKHYGGTVTVQAVGPTPYQDGVTYPFSPNYEGHSDLAPIAAEMYAYVARYGGQNAQLVRHRKAGTSTWCSNDYGYLADRYFAKEPVVDCARTGNLGWVKVSDYCSEMTDPYDLEIDVGSGQTVTVPVDSHGVNLFTFNLAS
ncbi:hypothetical protein [Spirosoma foliorum]|uniref:Uncharacterized protein n=1 Tax=Spirosoma foliorum TaxID=2710596 RepID=A0A7G5H5G0_9BACT|nr:hypothetical protein [Spirosoma foliorum]QMW06352.1 hypothetical protein H3H32_16410 [Spirosoma foliorum]